MLGDQTDPLALENEMPEAREALERYLNGECELDEAERVIDRAQYLGPEGAKHREEDEAVMKERGIEAAQLQRWIDRDIERQRIRLKAKTHKPTSADQIERVSALILER